MLSTLTVRRSNPYSTNNNRDRSNGMVSVCFMKWRGIKEVKEIKEIREVKEILFTKFSKFTNLLKFSTTLTHNQI
jgi:hypothetical protein